jgi:hypothetical protein
MTEVTRGAVNRKRGMNDRARLAMTTRERVVLTRMPVLISRVAHISAGDEMMRSRIEGARHLHAAVMETVRAGLTVRIMTETRNDGTGDDRDPAPQDVVRNEATNGNRHMTGRAMPEKRNTLDFTRKLSAGGPEALTQGLKFKLPVIPPLPKPSLRRRRVSLDAVQSRLTLLQRAPLPKWTSTSRRVMTLD